MSKKHVFFGIIFGLTLSGTAFIVNRLDLLHDDGEDYKEFEGR